MMRFVQTPGQDARVLVEAVATISNLSAIDETHGALTAIPTLKVLYSLLGKNIDIDVHFHVANTIANLASELPRLPA